MFTDVAGADNTASRALGKATDALTDLSSPYAKAQKQERAAKIKAAEDSGSTWEEVKAYAGSFADAPLDTTLNALGTSAAPLVVGALSGGAAVPAIVVRAAQMGLAAAQGVGGIKGQIHESVKQKHLEAGASEADASKRADDAQAYSGPNAGSIALGGALGAIAGGTGAESAVRRVVGQRLASEAVEKAAPGVLRAAATGAAKEAPMEMLQGGQERHAANKALQAEGFDVPTWQGVAGQAALEGLASAPMGGGFGAMEGVAHKGATQRQGDGAAAFAAGEARKPPESIKSVVGKAQWVRGWDAAQAQVQDASAESNLADAPADQQGAGIDSSQATTLYADGQGNVGPTPDAVAQRQAFMDGLNIKQEPVLDDATLATQGVTPAPQLDTGRVDALLDEQTPSQSMGLDPNAGALSKAAVLAVDSGASPVAQQTVPPAAEHAPVQQQAVPQAPEGVDPDTGEISLQAQMDEIKGRIAFMQQQGAAQGWSKDMVAQRNALQTQLTKLEVQAAAGQKSGASMTGAPAPAELSGIHQILAKPVPEMNEQELQQAIAHYGPSHMRTKKLEKALQLLAQKPLEAIESGAITHGNQTPEAKQGSAQPAQAGQAQAVESAASGVSAAQTIAQEGNTQREQARQRLLDASERWTRMPAAERQSLAKGAKGLNAVAKANVHKKAWADLSEKMRGQLADAIDTQNSTVVQENNRPAAIENGASATQSISARSPNSGVNRASGNGFEWTPERLVFAKKMLEQVEFGIETGIGIKQIAQKVKFPAHMTTEQREQFVRQAANRFNLVIPESRTDAENMAEEIEQRRQWRHDLVPTGGRAAVPGTNDIQLMSSEELSDYREKIYKDMRAGIRGAKKASLAAWKEQERRWDELKKRKLAPALAAAEEGKQVKAIVLDAPVEKALEAVKASPSANADASTTPAPYKGKDADKIGPAIAAVREHVDGAIDKATLIERLRPLGLTEAQVGAVTYKLGDDFTAADIRAVLTQPEPAAANDFPVSEAVQSYSGISHTGRTRAEGDKQAFDKFMKEAEAAGDGLAETDTQREAMSAAVEQLRADYLQQYRSLMNVRAGTYSGFVAGRGNLNSKQANARNSALDKAMERFNAWVGDNVDRVSKAVLAARTPEQVKADQAAAAARIQEKADKKAADLKATLLKFMGFKSGDNMPYGKNVIITKVSYDRDGYPSSLTFKMVDGSPVTDDKLNLVEVLKDKGETLDQAKARIRALVDEVRAENPELTKGAGAIRAAASAKAEKPAPAQAPAPATHLDRHNAIEDGISTGTLVLADYQSAFAELEANQEAVVAELSKLTKEKLLRAGGPAFTYRMKDDKKDAIVLAAYQKMLDTYALGRSYGPTSYFLSAASIAKNKADKAQALREMVANTTAEDLAARAAEIKAARDEFKAQRDAAAEALANPKSLQDFRGFMRHWMDRGETMNQAYLRLSPEQRQQYDALEAAQSKDGREAAKRRALVSVASAGDTTAGEVIATKHTKHGHDLFVVKLAERVERDAYDTLNSSAKRLGGSYSSYRGNGAVPGFQFRTREAAEAFQKLVGGDTAQAQDLANQRRDAFDDDKSQSAAERLRTMAEALEERASEALGADRKVNTARRARFAASADAAARTQQALAGTMRNIAQAIDTGTTQFLDGVRQRVQVEYLMGQLRTAKSNQLQAKYPDYGERMKRQGEPMDSETVDFAAFPTYEMYRSDWASLARQLLALDGGKKLGATLARTADDVTEAYTDWAKENLLRVSHFGNKLQGGFAEFASKDDAERAIKRSGLVGKAVVLPIKRGQNRVILSPSEAMQQGLWQGDGDKRISIGAEFIEDLMKLGKRKGSKALALPWQLENAYENRHRLQRMGILTRAEFRSALRELASLQQEMATPDRIKELELAMVGRANDGLDFFPTSPAVVQSMLDAAEIAEGMAVLEPSAGMGHIADAIVAESGVWPDVVELSPARRELLEAKGYQLAEVNDFTQMEPRGFFTFGDTFRAPDGVEGVMRGAGGLGSQRVALEDSEGNRLGLYDRSELVGVAQNGAWSGYDRIIMNPPFSDGRDIQHVQHAYNLLRPGGRIVAIMGEGAFFQSNKRAEAFREWLDERGATHEKLPDGSFMDTSLPVNTGVAARMVVIDKPKADMVTDGMDAPSFRREAADTATGADFDVASFLQIMNEGQPASAAASGAPAMNVRPSFSPAARAEAVRAVTGTADAIRQAWGNGPEVIVAFDMQDPVVPESARRADLKQRSGGARGAPEGFYYQGKVYLMASKLKTPNDAARVLFHEALGHHGLRGLFGKDLGLILNQVAAMRKAEVDAKITEYGLRRVNHLDRRTAAEEVLAEMAQNTPELGFVRRAVAAIRTWLRTHVPGFKSLALTDAELIRNYILPARAWVERGGPDGGSKADATFSREAAPELRIATNFTEAREAAKEFQGKTLRNKQTGLEARVSRNTLDKMLSRKAVEQSTNARDQSMAVANVDRLYEAAMFGWSKEDRDSNSNINAVHRFFAPIEVDGRMLLAKLTVKETADTNHGNPLYTVETVEFNEKTPAAQWVDASAKADGQDLTSIRSAGALMSLVEGLEQRNAASGDSATDEPMFSRSRFMDLKDSALDQLSQTFSHEGKVSLWDKSVGTMRHLAERVPQFKPVFEAAQRFIDDVSMLANDAADMAPRILPRVETLSDLKKKPVSAEDNKAIAKPLFEGTLIWARDENGKAVLVEDLQKRYETLSVHNKAAMLLKHGKIDSGLLAMWQGLPVEQFEKLINSRFESKMLKPGIVWTDSELKSQFGATDNQISLYRESRAAIDRSIDVTARTDMLRVVGEDYAGLREVVLAQPSVESAAQLLLDTLQDDAKANPDAADRLGVYMQQIKNRMETAAELQAKGYAPLSRFGRYTVDVVDANGERQYFGMYESQRESNLAKMQLASEFKGATITQGTMSAEAYKLFAGVTPETLEQFGEMLGLKAEGNEAQDKAFQEFLKLTKNNHSAMKRLIHRKGMAGFSEDVGRVVANFVYSNARAGAMGLNAGKMDKAIGAIPKEQGELKDLAMGLRSYIRDPQEEGQAVRGMLFAQYLGGSIASAFVNTTQPFAVTLPWLSQYGGMKKAGAQLARALKDMATKGHQYEEDLAKALQSAEDDGVVSPQEIHQLMAQARGAGMLRSGDGTKAGDLRAKLANKWEQGKVLWGQPFALAEQFNRRSTFIAAYRTAKEQGIANPGEFARNAVIETQFQYSKANKPRWARGAVGGTLFTFKTYSVSYLELMNRMWTQGGPEGKRAVGWALAMLLLMSGAGGVPFMEDAEDLIDGAGQLMGYNISAKQWRKEALASVVGKELGDFMEQGLSGLPGAPVDVSGRLGMGNLLPGTGLFLTKPNRERDLMEMVGPAGDLVSRGFTGARKLLGGDVAGAALEVSPTAVRNLAKGADMAATGMYRDSKGYKVIDTTLAEAAMKAVGFQPKPVAEVQEANSFMLRTKSLYTQTSSEIKAQWADALFRKDEAALADVRERLADWNRNNPEQPIVVKMPDVWKKVREMGKDRSARIADTAPKALREQMREQVRSLG